MVATTRTQSVRIEDYAGQLKSMQRDCRIGHCSHPSCRRRVDRMFAKLEKERLAEEQALEPDPGSGYTKEEEAAMWKDHMRDLRGRRKTRRKTRRNRRPADNRPSRSGRMVVILRADGLLDKDAMREKVWFG